MMARPGVAGRRRPRGVPFLLLTALLPAVSVLAAGPLDEVVVEADRPAGGGLLATATAAKSDSGVDAGYLALQAPTENAYQLIKLLPGANVANLAVIFGSRVCGPQGSAAALVGLAYAAWRWYRRSAQSS